MSIITSFFPSIFACIRPNQQTSAPLRSQSFDFFNSLDFDEDTGIIRNRITNTNNNEKKRKNRHTFLKSSSRKGKASLSSCIGTRSKNKDEKSEQLSCGLEARVTNDFMQIRPEPESPKSMSDISDSSSRQLISSTSTEGSNESPKRVIRPRTELNFTDEDIDDIKALTLQLVLSCIQLKEIIERAEVDEYVSRVKDVCESLKSLLIRVTEEVEQMPDDATEESKKMQMAQTLLQTQMKTLVQTMKQAQENSHLTIASHYTNQFLQSCVHLAVYTKHFLQAFLAISTFVC
ncbi:hypothetical protein LOD99_15040 [Oopsacas minuta]|uniref:Focal AT domain-containing protein n=1 Tax=Oopsacas minuta TaxID=111878 RepID=A0AAV7KE46_9METZ|nr:hypothetical protein LOD99_15040 [Oopsacas minuta]